MLWKRIKVRSRERALLFKDGRLEEILSPGEYRFLVASAESVTVERHSIRDPVFQSIWADHLMSKRPDLVGRHLTCVETHETQVALVYLNDQLFTVLLPARRILFWRDAAQVRAEIVDLTAGEEMIEVASA
jgi:hypothetical protein